LKLVDGNEPNAQKIKIGLLERGNYPPAMIQSLQSADRVFVVSWHPNEEEGKRWLKDRNGDGILVPSGKEAEGCALIVLAKASFQTVAIFEGVSGLQRALEKSKLISESSFRRIEQCCQPGF
jgi:hypothetical protein